MNISSSLKKPFMKSCVSTLALLTFVSSAASAQINEISEFDALAQSNLEQGTFESDLVAFKGEVLDAQAGKCVVETTWEHWVDGQLIGVGVTHGSPFDCGVSLSDPAGGTSGGAVGDSVVGVFGHLGGGGESDDEDVEDDEEVSDDEEDKCSDAVSAINVYLGGELGRRGFDDAFVFLGGIAENWGDLPIEIRQFGWVQNYSAQFGNMPIGPSLIGNGGVHPINVRLPGTPGGYHVHTEAEILGVFAHFDAVNPSNSLISLIGHGLEVGNLGGSSPGGSVGNPVEASQTFAQYCTGVGD